MRFVEDVSLSGARTTNDGYLVADVRCARSGVQQYAGSELGKPDVEIISVYRPEATVFSKDSLQTFAGKPVTDNHPDDPVTSKNWKEHAVGVIGEDVLRDGEHIRVPIVLMDQAIIDKVQAGQRQISMGYSMDLRWETGAAPDGTPYQAVMDNLKMNHLAVVQTARAGPECRIGDGDADGGKDRTHWGIAPLHHDHEPKGNGMTMSTVVLGDKAVQVAATDAPAIEAYKTEMSGKLTDLGTAHKTTLAAKDKELAEKDAKIADLEKKVLDDAALDARVKDRAKLIADASKLAKDADFSGMSDAEIRKTAVVAVRGDDAVKDKSQDYIDAAFDIALESAGTTKSDPVRDALQTRDPKKNQADDNGQTAYETRVADAWKSQKGA